jgi:hypothetical protein
MSYSIYTKTRSARLTVTTSDNQKITVENMDGDEGFRMGFEARRTMDDSPGEFTVTVFNLPPEVLGTLEAAQARRIDDLDSLLVGATLQTSAVADDGQDAIQAGFLVVEVEAGYDEQVSRVFRAIGARVRNETDDGNTTVTTSITAMENLDGALLGLPLRSFPSQTTLYELLDYLRQIAGLGPGNLSPATLSALLGQSSALDSPYHVSGGEALDHIRNVCQYLSLRWFIDDREIWFCGREGVSLPGTPPPWITDEIGEPDLLISPPSRLDGGRVEATCLLCPRLRVGRLVRLTEAGLSLATQGLSPTLAQIAKANVPPGLYRLDEVVHSGDTGGGEWTTRMLLRATIEPDVGP